MTDQAPVHRCAPSTVVVGCDVQAVSEVEASLRDFGQRYLDRVLHPDELARARAREDAGMAAHVSGRFAAKEAVFKTLGATPTDAVPWPDIEIDVGPGGEPTVRLHGRAAALAHRARLLDLSLSISHTVGFAFAVATAAVAEERGTPAATAPARSPQHPSQKGRRR